MLGMALKGTGESEQAIAEFREVIRLLPDNAVSHEPLGFARWIRARPDEAIASFTEAIRLVPASGCGTGPGESLSRHR